MRLRLALPGLLLTVLVLGVFRGRAVSVVAETVIYPSGWNLIGGPDGAHVVGASGALFTLQPGDTAYESFPVDSPLRGGWGYWAYFPSGGTLDTSGATDAPNIDLMPVPGQYTMVGNPTASRTVPVNSPRYSVVTYTPAIGYRESGALTPGQGAWITLVSGGDTAATPAVAPVAATSTAQATPAATPTPATPTPAPASCATSICTFTGDGKAMVVIGQALGGGFGATTTVSLQFTVDHGQVSGQGQYVDAVLGAGTANSGCTISPGSGQFTVAGMLGGTTLRLLFLGGALPRNIVCAGIMQFMIPGGSFTDAFRLVDVEAKDGGMGSASMSGGGYAGLITGSITITVHKTSGP